MLNANSNSCHSRQSRSTATFLRCARLLPLSSQPSEAQMLHNDPYSCRGRPCHSTAMVSCNIPDCRLRAIDHAELRRCTLNQTHAAAVDAIAPQRRMRLTRLLPQCGRLHEAQTLNINSSSHALGDKAIALQRCPTLCQAAASVQPIT